MSDFIGFTDITITHAACTSEVAQGEIAEPVFVERLIHEVDLAASN